MTEQATEPAADGEAERVQSIDARFERLEAMIRDAIGGGSEPAPEEPEAAPDVKAETRRAVAEVKRREQAKAARDKENAERESRLAAVEQALKEKPPREYRKVTRFMRWEDKDET